LATARTGLTIHKDKDRVLFFERPNSLPVDYCYSIIYSGLFRLSEIQLRNVMKKLFPTSCFHNCCSYAYRHNRLMANPRIRLLCSMEKRQMD